MQKLTKRTAIVETRAKNNEDDIAELQSKFDPVLQPEDGGTGWEHGLNSGINIVPGTSDEWSDWITPTPNTINQAFNIAGTGTFPSDRNVGDVYTCSIEIEFEKVTASSSGQFLVSPQGYVNGTWAGNWFDKNIWYKPSILTAPPEDGVKKFVWFNTMSSEHYTESNLNTFSVQLRCDYWASGRFRYRCLKIERGHVDYPQWTPAPEDITAINDMTTGINLIRGSRDFRQGTGTPIVGSFSNGFGTKTGNVSYGIDNEGFTYARVEKTSSSEAYVSASYFDVKQGDAFTYSGELKFEKAGLPSTSYVGTIVYLNSNNEYIAQTNIMLSNMDADIDANNITDWQLFKFSFTVNVANAAKAFARIRVHPPTVGDVICFKKLVMNHGIINNPVYSVAPADLALEPVNDITTGINLLRGTRDFSVGTKISSISNLYTDGFSNQSNATYTKDQTGFTVAHITADSGAGAKALFSSFIENVKIGDTFTVGVDVMTDNVSTILNRDNVMIQFLNSSASSIQQTGVSLLGTVSNVESNKWYRIHFSYTLTNESVIGVRVNLRLDGGGSIYFRKPCLYKGDIANPEWSISPFDIAQQIDLNGFNGIIKSENMLKSGDDLNNITKYDVYGCHTYSIVQTLKNIPPTLETAFVMHVESANGMSNTYRQRIVALNSIVMTNPRVFIRYKQDGVNGGAWTPWSETYTYTTVRPIEGGGTGGVTVEEARNNLKIGQLASSTSLIPSGGFSAFEDKVSYWKKLQSGNYWSQNPNIDGHWGFLTHLKDTESGQYSFQTAQLFFDVSENSLSYRTNNNSTESALFPRFSKIATFDLPSPYNSGLYGGTSIADKFKREIGSNHIANFLSSRASQGNFDGLNIGDWVDIPCTGATRRYVIAGFNVWRDSGNPTRLGNHIVFVPSGIWRLSSSRDGSYAVGNNSECISWSNSSSNNGTASESSPYLASNLHKWESEVAIKQFPQEWQDVMINRYDLVEVRYSASSTLTSSNGIKWVNLGKLWSLSEIDLYGTKIVSQNQACVNAQLPLFANINNRQKHSNRISYWLRDVANNDSSQACLWTYTGTASIYPVNRQDCYPYPCFLLG